MKRPETHYARSGDVHIAYQVVGDGPMDLVFVPGFISNIDLHWDDPGYAHLLRRLAAFCRLIQFDKRGTGLSDRVAGLPTLEQRMDDVRAVMDAVGCKRAALLGASEGGPMSMLFAATYPGRTLALILYGSYAHFHTWVMAPDKLEAFVASADLHWGTGASLASFAPGQINNPAFCDWWARFERHGTSPQGAINLARMNAEIDVRHILPSIKVPTLVMHRTSDIRVAPAGGHYLAQHILGARFKAFPGVDHPIWIGDIDPIIDEIAEFLTGVRPIQQAERVLATVLAIDIADLGQLVARLGDRGWLEWRERFRSLVAEALSNHRGVELGLRQSGALATFDGPARAVQCAASIRDAANASGIAVQAGLHTGEIEMRGAEPGGLAVMAAMRIAQAARPNTVLVSRTVTDLVAGSGLRFSDRGLCALEGLQTTMRLLAYEGDGMPGRPNTAVASRPGRTLALDKLSRREHEILGHVARGKTNPEIARHLALSQHTVKRHVANILMKLDLPTRAAATAIAVREGME